MTDLIHNDEIESESERDQVESAENHPDNCAECPKFSKDALGE